MYISGCMDFQHSVKSLKLLTSHVLCFTATNVQFSLNYSFWISFNCLSFVDKTDTDYMKYFFMFFTGTIPALLVSNRD